MTFKEISSTDVDNFKSLMHYLEKLSSGGVNYIIEKQVKLLLDSAVKFYYLIAMEDIFPKIQRLTINRNIIGKNQRINDLKYLKYPPKELVKRYGRCNRPGESILYASFGHFHIYAELKPRVGDLVTISKWNVKDNQSIKYSPIFRTMPKNGSDHPDRALMNEKFIESIKHFPVELKEHVIYLTDFVAKAFSKKIDSNNDLDYIFSAYFANKILNEYSNGELEAIFYPSVGTGLSLENIAMKPSKTDL